jgi:hypothetical protein
MAEEQFVIGAEVCCADGPCGRLRRVVLDPAARRLTHLVVGYDGEDDTAALADRLVPVALAEVDGGAVTLRLSRTELAALELAEEEHFVAAEPGEWGYEEGEAMAFPYYRVADHAPGLEAATGAGGVVMPGLDHDRSVVYDRVPLGEVEIRRGAEVLASDGRIGRVEGLAVDASGADGASVTHVLLQHGHLWGKRDVAVPIGAVDEVLDDQVLLRLSKDQVRDLPPLKLERHG